MCLVPTIGPRIEQSVRVHATAGVAVTVNPSVDHAEAPDDANGAQQGCVPVACEAFVRDLDARCGKSGQRPLAASLLDRQLAGFDFLDFWYCMCAFRVCHWRCGCIMMPASSNYNESNPKICTRLCADVEG